MIEKDVKQLKYKKNQEMRKSNRKWSQKKNRKKFPPLFSETKRQQPIKKFWQKVFHEKKSLIWSEKTKTSTQLHKSIKTFNEDWKFFPSEPEKKTENIKSLNTTNQRTLKF